jgi:acetyl-CoA carboxylase biotin carboxyl carrier protein
MSEEASRVAELLAIMREHELDALSVRHGETEYELVRREPAAVLAQAAAVPPPAESSPAAASPIPANVAAAHYKKISAPIIGVFYRSQSPGSEPFVEVGQRVEVGQVLCILEAMKLMNEITSDHAGVIRRILPENGALVTLGEEMFWIEP